MDGGEQLGRCLSFLDSGAIEGYGIHMKGFSKIVKNKTNSTFARLYSNTEHSNEANIFFVHYQSILIFKE
jgi:hypothetical protein